MNRLTKYPHRHWCNREYYEEDTCRACTKAEQRIARNALVKTVGKVRPFYILGIRIHLVYGGPEEGGWWADCTEICEVRKAYDWRDGLKFARELKKEFRPDPRGRSSVIGGPDGYVIVCRDVEDFPCEEGPGHYE